MKDRDESNLGTNSGVDIKEKKTGASKKIQKKNNSRILWVILVILVIGLVAFIKANNDTFHLSILSPAAPSCGTMRNSPANDIQSGARAYYNSSCRVRTQEQQDEKRWQDIVQASPVVIAASSAVTALSLIVLTWQVSRLVKTLSKRQ